MLSNFIATLCGIATGCRNYLSLLQGAVSLNRLEPLIYPKTETLQFSTSQMHAWQSHDNKFSKRLVVEKWILSVLKWSMY